ncbi:hypothetical protein [Ekhidna sp.]|uniref:hypothetical protein n=1 Tax=Ekhidna sp. TaxID=2608089 RepID=UPI00329A36D2
MNRRAIDEFDEMATEYQFLLPHIEQIYATYLLEFTPNQIPKLNRHQFFAKHLSQRENIQSTLDWWYEKAFDRREKEFVLRKKQNETISDLFFNLMEGILFYVNRDGIYLRRFESWLCSKEDWFNFHVLKKENKNKIKSDRQLALYLYYLDRSKVINIIPRIHFAECIEYFLEKEASQNKIKKFSKQWRRLELQEILNQKGIGADINRVYHLLSFNSKAQELASIDLKSLDTKD